MLSRYVFVCALVTSSAAMFKTGSAQAKPDTAMTLHTDGNRILDAAGQIWQGRGANLQDTRSCESCLVRPNVQEVLRRVDALVDDWGANFIRLTMENYASSGVVADPQYFADLTAIIDHIGKKKHVWLMLSMWHDPTLDGHGWPTHGAAPVWTRLVETFGDRPYILYGLSNEPERNSDGALDADVWRAMNHLVGVIRNVEQKHHFAPHLVSVQGTRDWARDLSYYVDHPIAAGGGRNIVYETHVYNTQKDFDALVVKPHLRLPVVIGEYGPIQAMTLQDCTALMQLADRLHIPTLAWTFHSSCAPNLIQNRSEHTCSVGEPIVPTAWGKMLQDHLRKN